MDKIGKYEILEKIGTGGFGVVFKGRDPFIKRFVAIKTCSSESEEMRKRFFREAEIAGNLQHRNVTTVYDFGFEGELPYLVQEYLPGEDLDQVIARRSLSDPQKLDYLIQVANGLAYAHDQGVIHRDIKPSNVRVVEGGRVKIMDFGIAKLAHLDSQLTKTGMTLGTASYLAPEQIRGDELTRAVDIFSFGVMAFELFANRRPFEGQSLSNLFYQVLSAEPPPLLSLCPGVPPELAAVIERCLAKDPAQRWPSVHELLEALEAVRSTMPAAAVDEVSSTQPLVLRTEYDEQGRTTALDGGAARQELAKVEARVVELLAAGNPTAAEIEVTLAQRRFATTPGAVGTLAPLLARVTEERSRRDAEQRRHEKVEGMVVRAAELSRAGVHDEAAMVLHTALELLPEHAEAQRLLRVAEESAAAERRRQALAAEAERKRQAEAAEAERRQRAFTQALAAVDERLSQGDLDAAETDLDRLQREDGERPEVVALRQRLGVRRREARLIEVRQEAERRAAAGDLEAALARFREAIELAPGDTELVRRGGEIERALDERRAAAARAQALEDAVILVQAALEQRRWDEAEATLRRATTQLGALPELERLARRLGAEREAERLAQEEARRAQEEARRSRMAELAAAAVDRRAAGDLAGAVASLEAALLLGSDAALAAQLEADRGEMHRRQQEAARRERVARAVVEVEAALGGGKAKVARRLAKKAISTLGTDPALTALAERAEAALRPAPRPAPAPKEPVRPRAAPAAMVATSPAPALARPAASASQPPARRGRGPLPWMAAGLGAVVAVVLAVLLWPHGAEPVAAQPTATEASTPPGLSMGAPPDVRVPASTTPPVAVPTAASTSPPVGVETPPRPTATSQPDDALQAGRAAAERARTALARGDHELALHEAAAASQAAPVAPEVARMLADLLRAARAAAADAAARAEAAGAPKLARDSLAAATSRRDAGERAAAAQPLEGARQLWQSATLFDAAAGAAGTEARRRELAQQAPTPAPVPSLAATVPPPPEPARTPEPASSSLPSGPAPGDRPPAPAGPSPADDTRAVLAVISRYQHAFESLDAQAVQAVWPSAPVAALQGAFDGYESLHMAVTGCAVRVDGSAATADCRRQQQVKPKAGRALDDNHQIRFRLRRSGEGWLIDGIAAQ